MIGQFILELHRTDGENIPSFWAYKLYAWLLEQLPKDYVDVLHQQGEKPISHYLRSQKECTQWVVNLLDAEAMRLISPVLQAVRTIDLHITTLTATVIRERHYPTAEVFMQYAKENAFPPKVVLYLESTTAFKQNNRYVLFPQEHLLVQSAIQKWNTCFPEVALDDTDAVLALEQGIYLSDYRIHSERYPLKATKIFGFRGSLTMTSTLSPPLQEIWNLLLHFLLFSGVGIKTTLGMGGVSTQKTT